MREPVEIRVGDYLRANNPRTQMAGRLFRVAWVMPGRVQVIHLARCYSIALSRIHTDGKPRRSGYSLVTDAPGRPLDGRRSGFQGPGVHPEDEQGAKGAQEDGKC